MTIGTRTSSLMKKMGGIKYCWTVALKGEFKEILMPSCHWAKKRDSVIYNGENG